MKILLATTLSTLASAISIHHEIDRVSSQAECDAIPLRSHQYRYRFNEDACACFFEFTGGRSIHCRHPYTFNPLHEPYNRHDLCISQHEYDHIFDHDLDAHC